MIPGRRGINDDLLRLQSTRGKPAMSARTTHLTPVRPVFLVDLFPPLHQELITLLRGLDPTDWHRPTACALWSVKDIAAHLLDTSLRRISLGRDRLDMSPDSEIAGYDDLVGYLNRLNAEWIAASRRLSPRVLIELLDFTAPKVHALFQSLDPHAPATFSVAWAGESTSANWFDIAREYTERWLHQQQIRDAMGDAGLMARRWLGPALDVFMRAVPFTYRQVDAEPGSSVRIEIEGDVWTLVREARGWELFTGADAAATAQVKLDEDTAWRLFAKSLPPASYKKIHIEGDRRLGQPLLGSVAVMA
jgi:uncharacterized protein (TIGR03083 family)